MSKLGMRRFGRQFLKNYSGGDNRQVPASGSSLKVFRQGVTVRTATTLYEGISTTVDVYDCGALLVGDYVSFYGDGSQVGVVDVVNVLARTVDISYSDPGSVALTVGERITPVSPSPSPIIYSDTAGTTSLTDSVIALDSTGTCEFYSRSARFDGLLYGGGITQRLYADLESGWCRGGSSRINARDYPTIQAAIDTLPPEGGTVFIPAGEYRHDTTPSFSGITVSTPNVTIEGERGTILHMDDTDDNDVNLITLKTGGITIRGLTLRGPGVGGDGCGIQSPGQNASDSDIDVAGLVFQDLVIYDTASWGIQLLTVDPKAQWNHVFERVTCASAMGGGSVNIGPNDTGPVQISMRDCQFNGPSFGTYGFEDGLRCGCVHLENCVNAVIDNCTFQPVLMCTVLSIDRGHNNKITNCHFEPQDVDPENDPDAGEYWVTAGGSTNDKMVFENIQIYRRTTTGTNALRFLTTDSEYAIVDWVIRDCAFYHNQSSPGGSDVVLKNNASTLLVSNVTVANFNTGVQTKLDIVNDSGSHNVPGVTWLTLGYLTGSAVLVGNVPAGTLGRYSSASPETASLSSKTLLTASAATAGAYRASFYMKTTTAGVAGDVVSITLAWNDGSAQTLPIGPLNLNSLNSFVQESRVVKAAASQNTTFTTTVSKTGSPQYIVEARIEALG